MNEPRIFKNTYDVDLGDKKVSLRLTVAAQLRLKNKFKQDSIDTIMDAAGDIEKMIAVFEEALDYKDNPNEGMTGEEFYDALVDNNTKGMNSFAAVLFNIANVSGILSDKQKDQVTKGINKTFNTIFESIESGNNADNQTISKDTEADHSANFPE